MKTSPFPATGGITVRPKPSCAPAAGATPFAAAVVAEIKVVADDYVSNAEPIDENPLDESIRRKGCKLGVERLNEREVEAELSKITSFRVNGVRRNCGSSG